MDAIIYGASERGLKIILDRHRPTSRAQSELWYTDMVSEEQWIANWNDLVEFEVHPVMMSAEAVDKIAPRL